VLRLPIVLAVMATGALALCGCSATATDPAAVSHVTVSAEHCGQGWSNPHPGQQAFVLTNRDIVAGEVFLADAKTGAVYAVVDDVGPAATAQLHIDLGSGRYVFRCAMSDRDVTTGHRVTVPGHARGGVPPVAPVSENDMISVATQYQASVAAALPGLGGLVAALDSDIHSGDLVRARADWLTAHLAYERLGAAYGAFGDLDGAINGTAAGLVGGVTDPAFTGFHRIEYGLWHGQGVADLTPYADRLVSDVAALGAVLDSTQVDPLDVAIRAHEIAENSLQFELTGATDYGSGSNLATAEANLEGTTTVLDLLNPVIAPRYPQLGETDRLLATTTADLRAMDVGGTWTPVGMLSTANRERIDSDFGELTELLAPIASICEPRRTS
jgi:iron uptake system component EfeO